MLPLGSEEDQYVNVNILTPILLNGTSLVALLVKNLPTLQEIWVLSLGRDDPLEKGMATHSSILAWRIPWTEEPGRLKSMGSQRVGHDWACILCMHFIKLTNILFVLDLVYNYINAYTHCYLKQLYLHLVPSKTGFHWDHQKIATWRLQSCQVTRKCSEQMERITHLQRGKGSEEVKC